MLASKLCRSTGVHRRRAFGIAFAKQAIWNSKSSTGFSIVARSSPNKGESSLDVFEWRSAVVTFLINRPSVVNQYFELIK
jgi:hypothetical protein